LKAVTILFLQLAGTDRSVCDHKHDHLSLAAAREAAGGGGCAAGATITEHTNYVIGSLPAAPPFDNG